MATACDAVLPKQPYAFTPLASLPTTAARTPTASTMTLATILIIESVLSKLNLLPSQLEALKVQGFITSERRRRRGLVYRLHFRMAGQQISRYLSTDPQVAAALQEFLTRHQVERRLKRRIRTRIRNVTTLVRAIKSHLGSQRTELGLHVPGLSSRQRRNGGQGANAHN
jgi:hypothetical protein